jgi:hypothetical protein
VKCLDWSLVLGRRHLERALREYVTHYNAKRPHRGIDLRAPDSLPNPPARVRGMLPVRKRDVLGGLIHEYELGRVMPNQGFPCPLGRYPGRKQMEWRFAPDDSRMWRYGPSDTLIRAPGCYAFRVEGDDFEQHIVFEATR